MSRHGREWEDKGEIAHSKATVSLKALPAGCFHTQRKTHPLHMIPTRCSRSSYVPWLPNTPSELSS